MDSSIKIYILPEWWTFVQFWWEKNSFWYWAKLTLDSSFQERNQDRRILARKCILFSRSQKSTVTPWNNAAILECFTRVLVNAQEEQEGGVVHPHLPGQGLERTLFGSCPCELWTCPQWNHLFPGVRLLSTFRYRNATQQLRFSL